MAEKLESFVKLSKLWGLEEVSPKNGMELFSYYLVFNSVVSNWTKNSSVVSNIYLVFTIDFPDRGKTFLCFDLFRFGKSNAKKLYDIFKPYSTVKNMDTVMYTELRDLLIKEFNISPSFSLVRKFPFRFIKKAFSIPEENIPRVIDTIETLQRFYMN